MESDEHYSHRAHLMNLIRSSRSWRHAHAHAAASVSSSSSSCVSIAQDTVETSQDSPESSLIDPSRLVLRVAVTKGYRVCRQEEGSSAALDSYAIVSCAGQRHQTHIVKNTTDPEWSTTFDLPLIHENFSKKQQQLLWKHGLVVTLCAKEHFRSTYLGQVQLPVDHLFDKEDPLAFSATENQVNRVST
ncbi:hypothetical protein BDF14DRAFT_1753934 [Spinellus fusiger]|nr:hypothetical protein BDF14DRAFT_1753934 [Spinellus fusiger]